MFPLYFSFLLSILFYIPIISSLFILLSIFSFSLFPPNFYLSIFFYPFYCFYPIFLFILFPSYFSLQFFISPFLPSHFFPSPFFPPHFFLPIFSAREESIKLPQEPKLSLKYETFLHSSLGPTYYIKKNIYITYIFFHFLLQIPKMNNTKQ